VSRQPLFPKILIANRGEIAIRIIRACRELSIRPVSIYSPVDRSALHVRYGAEAYPVTSYLDMESVIGAAKKAGAAAIHPGYGFMAESPVFAQAVEDAGLIFIGPPPEAIRLMGSKVTARKLAEAAGAPIIPGTTLVLNSGEEVARAARDLGLPVILKADAGGGGKGMRLIRNGSEIESAFRLARSEAEGAFGSGSVYLEKYLEEPRHIEIQVLGDAHGNLVTLGERECSIQRRHQKIIEECPSSVVTPELRAALSEAALKIVAAAGYRSAGTVEFLLDKHGKFYFMEMNTRLQVEHPVTELVTGIDLVKEMIRVAAGEPISVAAQEITLHGSAIECRIYAEDPDNNFMPCPGKVTTLRIPGGPGVRDETGVYEGYTVPVDYDPLISKLVCWGRDRPEAIRRMKRCLREMVVAGIRTTIPFLRQMMDHPDFLAGRLSTHFIDQVFTLDQAAREPVYEDIAVTLAAIEGYRRIKESVVRPEGREGAPSSPWRHLHRVRGLRGV
jgi:acetyl-CoA carboxylase biotin carboxylase subunit